jgi:hypothetical protein
MPRKTFTAGEVLAAADVNTFLMDQSVMTFADSAARGSAIPTPSEGMVTYLEDSKSVEVFDGTNFSSISSSPSGNAIINGAFDFWQRGTSFTFTGAGGYTADRFNFDSGGGGTVVVTQGTFAPGEELIPGFGARFFANLNFTTSGTGAADQGQRIEDVRTFAGQTITVSIWAKVSAGTHVVTPQVVQRFGSGGSSDVVTDGATWTLTTDWQRFSSTISVPSITGKTIGAGNNCQVRMNLATTGVKQFQLWGFQVEAGSTATPFRRNADSLQGELAACQRYYQRNVAEATSTNAFAFMSDLGSAASTTTAFLRFPSKVSFRVPPTAVEFSNLALSPDLANTIAVTNLVVDSKTSVNAPVLFATVASGLTQFRPYILLANNNTSAFVGLSAEL